MKAFPSTHSWVQAARLYLLASTGVLLPVALFWMLLLAAPLAMTTEEPELTPIFLVLSLASLLTGFIAYQVVKIVYWLLLKLLWADPPMVVRPQDFRASLHSYSVLLTASLPATLVCVFFNVLFLPENPALGYDLVQHSHPGSAIIALIFWLWLITAAYLYQWFPLQSGKLRRAAPNN